MTARNVASGVEKIAEANRAAQNQELEGMSAKWQEMRARLDTILLSNNVLKTDAARQECLKLDSMTPAQREDHVKSVWGPLYLERVSPLLHQLQAIETHMAKTSL